MDEIRIYNRALSEEEIKSLYEQLRKHIVKEYTISDGNKRYTIKLHLKDDFDIPKILKPSNDWYFGGLTDPIEFRDINTLNQQIEKIEVYKNEILTPTSLTNIQIPQSERNVALNAKVSLLSDFFTNGWGNGKIVDKNTIVDGKFLPRGNQWDQGAVWWDCHDGVKRYIRIDLGDVYEIHGFTVQADDNDAYYFVLLGFKCIYMAFSLAHSKL